MKIFVRTDLNMRKGKMGAQVSHAFGSHIISKIYEECSDFVINGKDVRKFVDICNSPIEIIPVSNESELLNVYNNYKNYAILITDSGRTEFNGNPTNTCCAVSNDIVVKNHLFMSLYNKKEDNRKTKQVIVINRDLNLDKWEVSVVSAKVSVLSVLNSFTYDQHNDVYKISKSKTDIISWLFGSFAKIVVKADSKEINYLIKNMTSLNTIPFCALEKDGNMQCVSIGPESDLLINEHTSDFKLY